MRILGEPETHYAHKAEDIVVPIRTNMRGMTTGSTMTIQIPVMREVTLVPGQKIVVEVECI